ncbi:MAG: F0F1 ATP synthase subunit gamma [Actinomycetota bacterium]|nr:F0F1 ATP synthase subunit gamma [Actinomycetota bacterium]
MARDKDIKQRIESVQSTQKITNAMGMIASSRIKRAIRQAE